MINANFPSFNLQALPHPSHPKIMNGCKLYKVPVVVKVNNTDLCDVEAEARFWLIATSPAAAANWVRDQLEFLPNTEIWAWGPKGGETYRYVGWDSAIGSQMLGRSLSEEEKRERIDLVFGGQP